MIVFKWLFILFLIYSAIIILVKGLCATKRSNGANKATNIIGLVVASLINTYIIYLLVTLWVLA